MQKTGEEKSRQKENRQEEEITNKDKKKGLGQNPSPF